MWVDNYYSYWWNELDVYVQVMYIGHALQLECFRSRSWVDSMQGTVYLQYYNMKYEETLKIHAGSDDQPWIQFAPPYIHNVCSIIMILLYATSVTEQDIECWCPTCMQIQHVIVMEHEMKLGVYMYPKTLFSNVLHNIIM